MGECYSKGWDWIKAGILSNLQFSAMQGETEESRELRRGLKGKEERRGELREERRRNERRMDERREREGKDWEKRRENREIWRAEITGEALAGRTDFLSCVLQLAMNAYCLSLIWLCNSSRIILQRWGEGGGRGHKGCKGKTELKSWLPLIILYTSVMPWP